MSGSLTSEEVNLLVYRYLLESGFIHSAFAFGHESLILKSSIDGSNVPPGALISFIQKGLQFVEIEAHVNDDGTEIICDNRVSALEPHKCNVRSKRRIFDPYAEENDEDHGFGSLEAASEDVSYFKGHGNIVSACSWHPNKPILASGSGDATARIWPAKPGRNADEHLDKKAKISDNVVVMSIPSISLTTKKRGRDGNKPSESMVIDLMWNATGSQLATGSYNGKAYTWDPEGKLLQKFERHDAPITALRWNPSGDKLLTASIDKTACVWNVAGGKLERQYRHHQGPVTDIDWKDDSVFALCSIDRTISVWNTKIDSQSGLVSKLEGHAADINMIRWSPKGNVLASCSDDSMVKIWNLESKSSVQDLTQHTREVCTIAWGEASNPGVLASGSFDATVRVWDAEQGKCTQNFTRHLHPVSSIAFNPENSLLASASHDRMYIWSLKDDSLVKTFRAEGGINSLSWDHTGTKLSGGCTNNVICTLDIRG
mmetsp:Transcript_4733/g.11145  ORF Transcript_4733/g.11145 Transcript_4733/m.11145 type:complete len:486 (-) Transcript_4733:302-1759(-)|eukprot:CAMPEP_0114509946 /NCGR_PEP_ID=MMETSP0109-20121206/13503_1 /TAXON_ID=29199 /ORGANISM="Chlorarachnion reptans, Strain CCCM449" /LENGTH=485 /DNA_ID=CAMNT_0001689177 /DNA_START=127 /DNA_END=1584 /DNA_ORIENTATION=-